MGFGVVQCKWPPHISGTPSQDSTSYTTTVQFCLIPRLECPCWFGKTTHFDEAQFSVGLSRNRARNAGNPAYTARVITGSTWFDLFVIFVLGMYDLFMVSVAAVRFLHHG